MSKLEVKKLQHDLNVFTKTLGVGALIVDGDFGPATKKRVRFAKQMLGFGPKHRGAYVSKEFLWQLAHPRSLKNPHKIRRIRARHGLKRRQARRKEVARNHIKAVFTSGVTHFDGVPVAKWMVPYLEWARRNGWQGRLVSGWRDPVYSERLCLNMCGAPSCPGRCAGRSSNHSGSVFGRGAVDVSDYTRFGQLMQRAPFDTKILNALGTRDPVHFSTSGR